jgi:siroheme synthase-like protein
MLENCRMLFPVMLDMAGRLAVVVGGGWATADKVKGLVAAGARVRLISLAEHADLAGLPGVEHERRSWRPGDIEGAFLVYACPADPANAALIFKECERRGIFCNAPDDVPNCSFIMPAIHRAGDLIVAVSTSGQAPAVAVRIKEQIAAEFGPEYGELLELLGNLREAVKAREPDFAARRALWYRLVDSEALQLLRQGDRAAARELVERITTG